jgi:hypothetical protein
MIGIERRAKHARVTRRLSVAVVSLLALGGATTFGALTALSPSVAGASPATWTVMPSPPASLTGVSCTSTSFCVAVGNSIQQSDGTTFASIEQWNGTTWNVMPSPTANLAGVSCTSPSFCMAGGASGIEQWNGSTWSTVPSPSGHIVGVSCTSASFCEAVGTAYPKYFIAQWNGSTWSTVPSPGVSFSGVSCPSSSFCMAAGSGGTAEWNGSKWSTVASPAAGNILEGISCVSASACTTVGYIQTNSNVGTTLIEQWNGATWSVVPSPSPNYTPYSLNIDELYGVSCTSASACTAVGYYGATNNLQHGPSTSGSMIEQWDGTSWTAPATASSGVTFAGIACPTASDCIAVGNLIETTAGGVTPPPAPVVSGVSPNSGPLAGGTPITVSGTGFTGATSVAFDGTAVSGFSVVNDSSITVTSPAEVSAGAYDVTVTTLSGGASSASSADQFTFVAPPPPPPPAPVVTSISPTSGPTAGGTSVTIKGTDLTGATNVIFGTVPATSFTVSSSTKITAVAPAEGAGAHDVTVTTPNGSSATLADDQFTAVAPPPAPVPAVTSISPTSGPTTGGTSVTIKGTGFNGAAQVLFGTVPAISFTVSSSTRITAVAPAQGAGWHNVFVTTAGGTSPAVTADQFTYVLTPPAVTSLSTSSGSTSGGTSVTIRGTNLSGATQVLFGSTPATSFTVASSTKISAVAPAGASGTVDVVVTTPTGSSAATSDDQFTYRNTNRGH